MQQPTVSNHSSKCSVFVLAGSLLLFIALSLPGLAQESEKSFDRTQAQDYGLGLPSPYDKFLGLDLVLAEEKIDWLKIYDDIAVDVPSDEMEEDVPTALALGVKIADGVMAIKARDAERLNSCADQIETLAGQLGVSDQQMLRAQAVKRMANEGEWLAVFLELGFLQTDIMDALREAEDDDLRTLIICSGWMQGANYTSSIIAQHYSEETSNFLREPLLVQQLIREMDALPSPIKSDDKVTSIIARLPEIYEIVNIPLNGSIAQDKVNRMNELTSGIVMNIATP